MVSRILSLSIAGSALLVLFGCASPVEDEKITLDMAPEYLSESVIFKARSTGEQTRQDSINAAYEDLARQILIHAGIALQFKYHSIHSEYGLSVTSKSDSILSGDTRSHIRIDRFEDFLTDKTRSGYTTFIKAEVSNQTLDAMKERFELIRDRELDQLKNPYHLVTCTGTEKLDKNVPPHITIKKASRLARLDCYRKYAEMISSGTFLGISTFGRSENAEKMAVYSKASTGPHETIAEKSSIQDGVALVEMTIRFLKPFLKNNE
jgi:hypothetical protein